LRLKLLTEELVLHKIHSLLYVTLLVTFLSFGCGPNSEVEEDNFGNKTSSLVNALDSEIKGIFEVLASADHFNSGNTKRTSKRTKKTTDLLQRNCRVEQKGDQRTFKNRGAYKCPVSIEKQMGCKRSKGGPLAKYSSLFKFNSFNYYPDYQSRRLKTTFRYTENPDSKDGVLNEEFVRFQIEFRNGLEYRITKLIREKIEDGLFKTLATISFTGSEKTHFIKKINTENLETGQDDVSYSINQKAVEAKEILKLIPFLIDFRLDDYESCH
jgi:hypothetical protein